MAVSAAEETFSGKTTTQSDRGNSYVRVFYIRTSADNDDHTTSTGLPALYDDYPSDPNSIASSFNYQPSGNGWKVWTCTVSYEPKETVYSRLSNLGPESQQTSADPTTRPSTKSGGGEMITIAPQQDVKGNKLVNTAKTPFDPPFEITIPCASLVRIVNESTEPTSKILNYMGSVNSSGFLGFDAGTVMVKGISYTHAWWRVSRTEQREYFPTTYSFLIRSEGKWTPIEVVSRGYEELVNGQLKKILSSDGYPITMPADLDENGRRVANGSGKVLKFYFFREKNFSQLGISS